MSDETVVVATHPFAQVHPEPLRILERTGARLVHGPWARKPKPVELAAFLAEHQAHAVVAGSEPYDALVLDASPNLRLVARTGIGLDGVDLEGARERGIVVTHVPEGPSDSAAELALGFLISLARQVPQADRELRSGGWTRRVGWLLKTRTVGILGFGRIGSRVARMLRAMGSRVIATDIDPAVAPSAQALGVELVDLDTLLASSDLITIHVPRTPLTEGLLNAERLAQLRRGALLVNTARGEIVDEAALIAALDSGQVGGAALDVFPQEPYTGPLAQREDVLLTCHMGSCTDTGRIAMESGAAQAVADWLEGKEPRTRVV